MSFFGMGGMEIVVIMIVALIIFGPGKLPEIGAQVGKAVRDFRRMTTDLSREFDDQTSEIRSTMDEMKGAVAQMERETKELAQSIPASIEGAATGATPAAASRASSESAAATEAAPATDATVATPAASAPQPARAVPTKDDPLADLEMLDDEVFTTRTPSTS